MPLKNAVPLVFVLVSSHTSFVPLEVDALANFVHWPCIHLVKLVTDVQMLSGSRVQCILQIHFVNNQTSIWNYCSKKILYQSFSEVPKVEANKDFPTLTTLYFVSSGQGVRSL